MTKTRNKTKSDEAYRVLKSKLRGGEFRAGERLTETRLVEMLDMGRSSIREALLRLESEGLLTGRGAYGGKYVRFIEDENLDEVLHHYELREMVEGLAARLAAMNMTGWQIEELRALEQRVEEAFKSGDRDARNEAGADFHRYLIAHCGNPLLLAVWESYYLMPLMPRSEVSEEKIWSNFPKGVRKELELAPIVEAISAHDPDAAERAMRELVHRVTHAIRKVMLESDHES